jgi:hypothetical protein
MQSSMGREVIETQMSDFSRIGSKLYERAKRLGPAFNQILHKLNAFTISQSELGIMLLCLMATRQAFD